jgi:iron(III) transport system substrate-binding protein
LDKNVAVYLHSGSKPAKDTAAGEYGIGISFGYRCIKSVEEVGNDIAEVVFPEEGSGWDIEANALIQKDKEKDVAKKFLDWAISDNVMEKYAKNYPIIATGTGDSIPEGYTVNPIDQLITGIDFEELAINREDVLSKWTDRYDGKSAQK